MPSPDSKLPIVTFCAYLTEVGGPKWRPEDFTASKMVKALKGDEIKGFFELTLKGARKRFDSNNIAEFIDLIPNVLATGIRDRISEPALLVPIPNAHVTSPDAPNFKTLDLARKVADRSKGLLTVAPMLVFKNPQVKSREGGPRSPFIFESEYSIVGNQSGNIVLLDDVTTTGGHMIGAAWKLNSKTRMVILGCEFGGSTKEQEASPVGYRDQELSLSKGLMNFEGI